MERATYNLHDTLSIFFINNTSSDTFSGAQLKIVLGNCAPDKLRIKMLNASQRQIGASNR